MSAGRSRILTFVAVLTLAGCSTTTMRSEQFRLPASYNFAFYETYREAARSFYAAHFAHFSVYEVGLTKGEDNTVAMADLERQIRAYVIAPPVFEPPAELIAPQWAKIAFATGRSMDWTHMLHSQLYDILSDDRVTDKKAAGERAIAYYVSNTGSAFSTRGYGHRWMLGGGSWAGVFARKYPGINGILWAYHWHHAAVYEALMESDTARRRAGLDRVIRTFTDSVLANPPAYMPLMAEVAPRFSRLFPAAAHIFDNLHMMHDVVNDVMVDERLARQQKSAEIERMRLNTMYASQDAVVAPGMPMHGDHAMSEGGMRVPTQLADGSWLPQGHPEARMATMDELMMPLLPAARAAQHIHREDSARDPAGRAARGRIP
ncbi:MAG: hypothetical protein L0271_04390 [Gemmatimonadetes bacterium]|nr:hypothetical protein [Gemmatimonadota bacterium]